MQVLYSLYACTPLGPDGALRAARIDPAEPTEAFRHLVQFVYHYGRYSFDPIPPPSSQDVSCIVEHV